MDIDYKKLYNETLQKLYEMVSKGIITEEVAKGICADFAVESEDEKIRQFFIHEVEETSEEIMSYRGMNKESVLAWLKKQGEQKPIEDINGEDYGIDSLWHAQRILEITLGEVEGYQSDDGILEHKCAITAVRDLAKKQGEQNHKFRIGNTIKKVSTGDIVTISEIDLKNREYRLSNTGFIPFKYEHLWELVEQKPVEMIQWNGDNLKEVIDFTGKSDKLDEWFSTWEDYEKYVLEHNNILKLFNEDGSHYEVPVGAWIVKTPDGHNIPTIFTFKQKPAEWSEEDESNWITIQGELLNNKSEAKKYEHPTYDKLLIWFDSIKDRVRPQPKQDWSDKDEAMMQTVINRLELSKYGNAAETPYVERCVKWIKTVKDRIQSQSKQGQDK